MYKIFADDTLIYDSTLEDFKICKGSISLELNKSGSFTFSVYPDHFYYDSFAQLKTIITVYKSGKIVFRGRILSDVTDYWNNKVITCEGELGFLQDSIIRPFTFIGYPEDLLKAWIDDHNDQVDEFKQFKLGKVSIMPDDKDYLDIADADYKSTFDRITDHLTKVLNGYLYITHGEDGTDPIPTLNYVADFEKVSAQSIEFGSNLKNYTKTVNANDIATAIIPLGAEVDDGNDDTKDQKLTIASVNNGLDYVYDAVGVALYGWIYKVETWDDITSAGALKYKAEKYLADVMSLKNTIELNAIDLHLLNPEIESISIGEYVRAISTPHKMNITLLCSGQSIDILNPDNDSFTLGYNFTTASKLNNDLARNIKSNYITNRKFTREFSKTASMIEQTEETIKLGIEGVYAKQTELVSLEKRTLSQIAMQTDSILLSVSEEYTTKTTFETNNKNVAAEIELKVGKDDNNQIISMINASANVIDLKSNRLSIDSTYFKLTTDGVITATSGYIGDCEIINGVFTARRLKTKPINLTDNIVEVNQLGFHLTRENGLATHVGSHGFIEYEGNKQVTQLYNGELKLGNTTLDEENLIKLLELIKE